MWAIARVPLSNPDAALEISRLIAAPRAAAFRASRPASARPPPSASGSGGQGAVFGGASGPAGRLETVQKLLTRGGR